MGGAERCPVFVLSLRRKVLSDIVSTAPGAGNDKTAYYLKGVIDIVDRRKIVIFHAPLAEILAMPSEAYFFSAISRPIYTLANQGVLLRT